jgi:hypothetical protein
MAFTPQELAALQAGIDPRAYFTDPMAAARAGLLDPETIQRGPNTITPGSTIPASPASRIDKAKDFAQNALTRTRGALGQVPLGGLGVMGGAVAPVLTAVSEAQAGRPTGALGALGLGAAGVGGGALLAKMLPGTYGKIASAVLPAIGGLIAAPAGASLAESAKRSATGDPIAGKDDLKNTLAERGLISDQDLDIFSRSQGIQTSNIKDLTQFYSNQQYLDMQRMNPLIQKMKNADLVRQQALMATQGQQYAMLGTLATAGKLATGSQAEMGATLRTALQSNPYASANLQAPSIAFG